LPYLRLNCIPKDGDSYVEAWMCLLQVVSLSTEFEIIEVSVMKTDYLTL
jgi:hypothetical protein